MASNGGKGEGENKRGRGRQQQGRMIKTLPFLQQSSVDKKALKNTTISHQNGGDGDKWLLENGAGGGPKGGAMSAREGG